MTPFPYRLLTGLLGLAACLTFNSCQNPGGSSSSGSSDVVDYTSPTSKMSKKEKENYAFDDSGKYRETWVAANAGGRVKTTSMSTDSPYVREDTTSRTTTASQTTTAYNPGRVSSPAYADTPPVSPRQTVASTSSSSSGATKKSTSSSSSRKSAASKSSGSKKSTASAKSKKTPSKSTAKPTVVTIKPTDTLYGLSQKTGVPVEKLKAYNGMTSDVLIDGKKIKIPPKKKN